jgi:tetratricopeptide (TPR) repeat protein
MEARAGMEIYRSLYPTGPLYNRGFYIHVLLCAGRITEAEQVLKDLGRDLGDKHPNYMWRYWGAQGNIEMAKGNLPAALADLEKADKAFRVPFYPLREMLAQAYLGAGKLGEAVAVLEQMLSRYDSERASWVPRAVKDHYILGTAYEKSGWTSKAIEQYQEFLETWKDADLGIPEIEDARQRLARLKAGA